MKKAVNPRSEKYKVETQRLIKVQTKKRKVQIKWQSTNQDRTKVKTEKGQKITQREEINVKT